MGNSSAKTVWQKGTLGRSLPFLLESSCFCHGKTASGKPDAVLLQIAGEHFGQTADGVAGQAQIVPDGYLCGVLHMVSFFVCQQFSNFSSMGLRFDSSGWSFLPASKVANHMQQPR